MNESKAVKPSLNQLSSCNAGDYIGTLKWSDCEKMFSEEDDSLGLGESAKLDASKGVEVGESKSKVSICIGPSADAIERRERVAREATARRNEMRKMMAMNRVKLAKENNKQKGPNGFDAESTKGVATSNDTLMDTKVEDVAPVKNDDSNSIGSAQKEERASITVPPPDNTRGIGGEHKQEKTESTLSDSSNQDGAPTAAVKEKVAESPGLNQSREAACDDSRLAEKNPDGFSTEEPKLTESASSSISLDSLSKFNIPPTKEADTPSRALSEYYQLSKSSPNVDCESIFSKSFLGDSSLQKSLDGRSNDQGLFPLEDVPFDSLRDQSPSIESLLKARPADGANDFILNNVQTCLESTQGSTGLLSSSILGGLSDPLSIQTDKSCLLPPSDSFKLDDIRANTHQKIKEVMADYELCLTRHIEKKLCENQTNFQEQNVSLQKKNLELEKNLLRLSEEHGLLTAKYTNAIKEADFLKARISLLESKLSTLQGNLELKVQESTQLAQLCDELITRLESNSKG